MMFLQCLKKITPRKIPRYTLKVKGKRDRKIYFQNPAHSVSSVSSHIPHGQANFSTPASASLVEDDNACTSYKEKRESVSQDWRNLEAKLLNLDILMFSPVTFQCCSCRRPIENIVLCKDCGVHQYFCKECWTETHAFLYFHSPEIWSPEKNSFVKMQLPNVQFKRNDDHNDCSTLYTKEIVVVDFKGLQHEAEATFCRCESEPETLLRYRLWAGSAKSPKVAFSVELLELLRVLMMEKQVSTEGFFNALDHRFSSFSQFKKQIRSLSRILLNESMESYRHHIYKLKHLVSLKLPNLDDGTACPACFKIGAGSPATVCLDGNFGLVRRNTAYQSMPPHHKGLFFGDQPDVDRFVEEYGTAISNPNCSDFQAGSEVRSKGKNKKLSINGMFGSCCKHEMPTLFVDIKHGERIGYSIWIISQLLERHKPINIFYDIACRLEPSLKARGDTNILPFVKLLVPVFHGYGHNLRCQEQFSPRNQANTGLSDGESMERLWSYLRNFNKITKEMKPEHRTDVITDGLLHYTEKKRNSLGAAMVNRLEKSYSVQKQSKEDLTALLSSHPRCSTIKEVADLAASNGSMLSSGTETPRSLSAKESYAIHLHKLLQSRQTLNSMEIKNDPKVPDQCAMVAKFEKETEQMERKLNIARRWSTVSDECIKQTKSGLDAIRQTWHLKAVKLDAEKRFISSLIKKYPVGQAIVQKLISSLKRVTKNLKKIISEYNQWSWLGETTLPCTLSFDSFSDIKEESLQPGMAPLLTSYNLMMRAQEEECFTKCEMANSLLFYAMQIKVVTSNCTSVPLQQQPYLATHLQFLKHKLMCLITCYKPHIDVSNVMDVIEQEDILASDKDTFEVPLLNEIYVADTGMEDDDDYSESD